MVFYLLMKTAFLATLTAFLIKPVYSVRKTAAIITVFHLVVWLGNYLVYRYFGEKILNDIYILSSGVPGFICFSLVAKHKGARLLFTIFSVMIFGIFSGFLGYFIVIYIPSFLLQSAVKLLSFLLILFLVVKFFRKPYLRLQETMEDGWVLLCLIQLFLISILCLLLYFPLPIQKNPGDIPIVLFVFALSFVFYAILSKNFESIRQFFELRRDKEILAVQTDMYKKHYEDLTIQIKAMRIYRHDMRHHLGTINSLLSDSNISEAQKYIRQLDGNLSDTVIERYCENTIVNVMLSSSIQKARNDGIDVRCETVVPPDVSVDPVEIGLIFANAIENAANACKKIDDPGRRKISIICREQKGQLLIRISNPYAGEVRFDGEYPVPENAEHGTGTKSIAAIASMHGGLFSFTAQDGVFNTTVTLNY